MNFAIGKAVRRMAAKKRLTDIMCWEDPWFQELSPTLKCLWKYICDKCDCAGVWKVNKKLADFQIGAKIDWAMAEKQFSGRVECISEDKWMVVKFLDFQYGTLSPDCRPHIPVYKALSDHGLTYPLNLSKSKGMPYPIDTLSTKSSKGINTLEEKEKEKEKDQEKDLEKDAPEPKDAPSPLKSWRDSFDVYLAEETEAYLALRADEAWIAERQKYHPQMDIVTTLEKSHVDFWGTVAGWDYKKRKKSKIIDWKSTFSNALSQSMNKVYKPRFGSSEDETPEARKKRINDYAESLERSKYGAHGL